MLDSVSKEAQVVIDRLKLDEKEAQEYDNALHIMERFASFEKVDEEEQETYEIAYGITLTRHNQYLECFADIPEPQRRAEVESDCIKLGLDLKWLFAERTIKRFEVAHLVDTHKLSFEEGYKRLVELDKTHPQQNDDPQQPSELIHLGLQRMALEKYGYMPYSPAFKALENLSTSAFVPQNYVAPNHKLVNALQSKVKTLEESVELVINVNRNSTRAKQLLTTCVLSYEGDNVKLSGKQPFTEFDRAVYNAITSLYIAGNRYFTADTVARTMKGNTAQEKPTKAQVAAVKKSIDKMRFTRVTIDCKDEFISRHITMEDGTPIHGGGYNDNLLYIREKWMKSGNRKYIAYELLVAPILYEYSSNLHEVISVPIKMLDIKKVDKHGKPLTISVPYTEQRSMIKNYLLRRIKGMMGKNSLKSNCIRYTDDTHHKNEGLYTIAGKQYLNDPLPEGASETEINKRKNDARQIREDVHMILDYWVAFGSIHGYEEYKQKRTTIGVKIIL